jgi:hypothetical protein
MTDVVSARDEAFIRQLLDQAQSRLTGSSLAALKAELFDVYREFFNDTSCWTEDIPLAIVPNTTSYPISVSEGQIIRLIGVVDGNTFPQPALMPEIGTIVFRDKYSVAQTFTVTVAKNIDWPKPGCEIPIAPSWLLAVWGVGILDGLLGRMMMFEGKPWSNQKLGTYHAAKFRDAISRARVAALRRNTLGSQAWSYPRQFRTRGQRGGVSVGNSTSFG